MIGRHLPVHFVPSSSDLIAMVDRAMSKFDRARARHATKVFSFGGETVQFDELMVARKEDAGLCAWAVEADIGASREGFVRVA